MSKQASVPKFPTSQAPGGQADWQQLNRSIQALAIFQQTVQAQPPLGAKGSTGGFLFAAMPFQGASFKVVLFQFAILEGTASYVFPVEFANLPAILTTDQIPASVVTAISVTSVTVTTATPTTGFLFLMGF